MIKFFVKIVITVILIAVIVWKLGDLGEVLRILAGANPYDCVLILVVVLADRSLMTFKWGLLLHAQNQNLPFLRGLKFYLIGSAWGQLLPATGGDVFRAYLAVKDGFDSTKIITSIVIERVIGFLCSLIFGLAGFFVINYFIDLGVYFAQICWAAAIIIAITIAAIGVSFNPALFKLIYRLTPSVLLESWIFGRLRKIHETYLTYGNFKKVLWTFFLLTLVKQLAPIAIFWLAARALGLSVDLAFLAGVVSLSVLIARLPISISGVGVVEGVFMILMPLAHLTPSEAVSIALVARILAIVAAVPWWVVYIVEPQGAKRAKVSSLDDVKQIGG